ncbi:MAG TPA: hypothetical protein VH700_06340 [Gemmatimonadales bacterium]|jgi:hypothetical protein
MKRTLEPFRLGLVLLGLTAGSLQAQSGGPSEARDTIGSAPDSAVGQVKKKKGGGLFGKAKSFAGSKGFQQAAKTMACTMVPGGQVVAGAIDAAASKDLGDAAAGAAGAASGQGCMPAGLGPAPQPSSGMAAAAGLSAAGGAVGLAGMQGGRPGGDIDQASGAMAYGAMAGGPGLDETAACMGLTPQELLTLTDPTGGEPRQPTKEEMDRQRELAAKMDMARYQACMMGQQVAATTGDETAPAGGNLTEAPGKTIVLPSDPQADLRKGRVVLRDIDWLAGGATVSEAGLEDFDAAMATLAAALREVGGPYRADIYLDKHYQDEAAAAIGSARLKTVVTAIQAAGAEVVTLTPGKAKKDKRPRLEIVRVKS